MESEKVLATALEFEKKIRDLYRSGEAIVDDERGRSIFRELADEEQSHIDFLENSLILLKNGDTIDPDKITTTIPDIKALQGKVEGMKNRIPDKMLGDIKRVLSSALQLEIETTEFYKQAREKTTGDIRKVMEKFVEIEQRHTEVVRMELDYASNNGFWFDFMELSMEVGWKK